MPRWGLPSFGFMHDLKISGISGTTEPFWKRTVTQLQARESALELLGISLINNRTQVNSCKKKRAMVGSHRSLKPNLPFTTKPIQM